MMWEVAMKIEIDRFSFAMGALAAVSIALLCSQTLVERPQTDSVERVMTVVIPAARPAASVTDPDSGSKVQQDASPQADKGVCQGKAPDCWNDQGQSSSNSDDDDDSFDPPDPTDPVPA
jgi:hypothetical protein